MVNPGQGGIEGLPQTTPRFRPSPERRVSKGLLLRECGNVDSDGAVLLRVWRVRCGRRMEGFRARWVVSGESGWRSGALDGRLRAVFCGRPFDKPLRHAQDSVRVTGLGKGRCC